MLRFDPPGTCFSLTAYQKSQRDSARRNSDPGQLLYKHLDTSVKDDIRKLLAESQGMRCAYCETRLPDDLEGTVVEHFHPRGGVPVGSSCLARIGLGAREADLIEIHISNLLLSCDGGDGGNSSREDSCDEKKGDSHVCEIFHFPRGGSPESLVKVLPGGKVEPLHYPSSYGEAAKVVDDILNLNNSSLVHRRRLLYMGRMKEFVRAKARDGGRTPAAVLRKRAADSLRSEARTIPLGSTLYSLAHDVENP